MNRGMIWTGRVMSALVVLALLADAADALFAPAMADKLARDVGFPIDLNHPLGGLMIVCALVYAVPQTAVLGAILVTGFLGGAICAHVRIGELGSPPQLVCAVLGLLAWGGLYLRDARLKAMLPLVR